MVESERAGSTLDTGALIAIERGHELMRSLMREADFDQIPVAIPATALAQTWRGGPRQSRLAALLKSSHVRVRALDENDAKEVGVVSGRIGHADIADVQVVLCARKYRHYVVTSDAGDLRRVDPDLGVVEV